MSFDSLTLSAAWSALGAAVLQFLWQGALIGLVTAAVLRVMPGRSARGRHAVACGALLFCLGTYAWSFVQALGGSAVPIALEAEFLGEHAGTGSLELGHGVDLPQVAAWCWSLGVIVMTVRLVLFGLGARRLRRTAVAAADASWQHTLSSLARELGIQRTVRLLRSGLAEVPMVVGWLSPVVLVPASAFTALSPDQLRALFVHELAHIRRHDHLWNAAQAVIETLLFFHPAVWWISRQVRIEREYCCDESSVRLMGNPVSLAEALTTMESLRIQRPTSTTVLAANGGPLMQRITRILGMRTDRRGYLSSWQLPAGLALVGMLSVAGSAFATPTTDLESAGQEQRGRADEHGERAKQDARAEYARLLAELAAMVEAGRITEAQAKEKLIAFRRRLGEREEKRQEDPEAVIRKNRAAVESGELSSDQAEKKIAAYRQELAQREKLRAEIEEASRKIQAAVKAGELTPEEGRKRLAVLRERLAARDRERAENPEAVIKKIQAAVETGSLSPEEGRAKIAAYRKELAQREAHRAEREAMERRIRSAVEAGELTAEEGRARMEAFRKKLGAKQEPKGEDPELAIKKIQAAVEAGKLTPAEGKAKIEAYRRELAQRAKAERDAQYEARVRRIKGGVAGGKLTPEQGKERIEALGKERGERIERIRILKDDGER